MGHRTDLSAGASAAPPRCPAAAVMQLLSITVVPSVSLGCSSLGWLSRLFRPFSVCRFVITLVL